MTTSGPTFAGVAGRVRPVDRAMSAAVGIVAAVRRGGPILAVTAAILVLWYLAAAYLNASNEVARVARWGVDLDFWEALAGAYAQDRPFLPAPHQILGEIWNGATGYAVTSNRSLLFHAAVTLGATALGFLIGSALGVGLAAFIVHSRAADLSLLPWIIISQTIPILAIAPMFDVVLGSLGLSGLMIKALIGAYLSFFPVAVGMVKGFRSPDPLQLDLLRTYSATKGQSFWKLRWPSATPFLFASMKVAVALSLVGAIVGEVTTGATGGLGARLLLGSYNGQTIQMWAALVSASILAALLVAAVANLETVVRRRMGAAGGGA